MSQHYIQHENNNFIPNKSYEVYKNPATEERNPYKSKNNAATEQKLTNNYTNSKSKSTNKSLNPEGYPYQHIDIDKKAEKLDNK